MAKGTTGSSALWKKLLLLLAVFSLIAGACSSDGDGDVATEPAAEEPAAEEPAAEEPAAEEPAAEPRARRCFRRHDRRAGRVRSQQRRRGHG